MRIKNPLLGRTLLSVALLVVIAAFALPQASYANSTADATIVNVVQVDYTDVGGANSFSANASSSVTINLVKAALNTSAPPTGAAGSPGLSCLAAGTFDSGSTVSALYAVAATANGDDTYNFAIADDGSTTADVNNITRVYSTRTYTGSLETANPATRVLGSAIPVATSGTDTLLFPGGALAGFEVNDIVLLTTDGGVKAYLVAAVSAGAAPVHSNPGNTAHSDLEGFSTAEVQGSLQLKAYADQTVSLNGANVTFGGGNAAPAFATVGSIPDLSVPVSEMVLVQVDITASASVAGTDGNVGYTLTTTDSDTANPATISCTVGVFDSVDLSIQKDVRNFTDSGAFAATASGNPGDTLEYRVTITNNGGDAADVTVTDAVPAYTSLVTHSVAYGDGLGGNIFATINDGTSTVVLTNSNADSETQPGAPTETGYGNNAGTTAGSAITFYVGDTSDNASGGIVTSSDTFTIIYQVQID